MKSFALALSILITCLFFGHVMAQQGELILSRKKNPDVITKIPEGAK